MYHVIALIFLSLLFETREDLFELNEKEDTPTRKKKEDWKNRIKTRLNNFKRNCCCIPNKKKEKSSVARSNFCWKQFLKH